MSQDNYGRIPPSGRPWWLLAHVTQQLPQNKQTAAFLWLSTVFQTIFIKESPQIVFHFFLLLVLNMLSSVVSWSYYLSRRNQKKNNQQKKVNLWVFLFTYEFLPEWKPQQMQSLPKGQVHIHVTCKAATQQLTKSRQQPTNKPCQYSDQK